MPTISGGNIIQGGTVIAGAKPRIAIIENAVPTDALVGGGYRTPVNGELAANNATGYIYERQTGVWVRIDTL